ncbi:hypothetical protein RQP46_004931 [Phenoliferia psychrophenolica]
MDSLDSCLHASILSSLAANLASTSSHDDLGLLTDSFAAVEPVTNGVVNGILSRLGTQANGDDAALEFITLQQAESIIAFAEYSASAGPSDANLARVLALLQAVPSWEVEAAWGVQASLEWALPDQLAFALTSAALALTTGGAGDRGATLGALAIFQQTTVQSLESAQGHRIIAHLLPVLNGCRRAIRSTPFQWTFSDAPPSKTLLSESGASKVGSAVASEWDAQSEEGRAALATLQLYQSSLKGLSPALVSLSLLELREEYLVSALVPEGKGKGWARLASSDVKPLVGSGAQATSTEAQALAVFGATLQLLGEEEQDTAPADQYVFDLLRTCLTVATLSCIATGVISSQVIALVESLASEGSPVTDESLQARAVECLSALTSAFPAILSQSSKVIRAFILSPALVFELGEDFAASATLRAACDAYAACIELIGDPEMRISAIQSLLNHFTVPTLTSTGNDSSDSRSVRSGTGTLGRSDTQKDAVSTNVVHAVARLAVQFADPTIQRVVVSMLLQKRTGTNTLVDGAIMFELAELGGLVDLSTFKDIAKAFSDVSKAPASADGMSQAVLAAQTKLATSSGSRKELHSAFIVELLSLFVDTGMAAKAKGQSNTERTQALLSLIPVLDAFFTSAKLDPRRKIDVVEVALFRNMWYLCSLSGFLSTPSRIADWQRAALVRIAVQTPCLVADARHDFIETEVEFSTILRRASHVLSPDVVRSELANVVPQQAGHIRSLPAPQAVFLATVLHVESLRAEAGSPSTILSYFEVEGINNSPMHTTLVSIAEKVNAVFILHFSELVTTHSITTSVFGEIRTILTQCCHQYAKVRSVAVRSLNDLISNFPSLICETSVITTLLELLTAARKACQSEFVDEYTPTYTFHSVRGGFILTLPDDYIVRNTVLTELHQYAKMWLKAGITRAPFEMQGLLQDYIDGSSARGDAHAASLPEDEMGKSVAIDMIRTLPAHDKAASLPSWGGWKSDNSSQFARTFGTRNFFEDAGQQTLLNELADLQEEFHKHKLHVKLAELRSLLYRCAAHLVKAKEPDFEILRQMVSLPVAIFTEGTVALGQEVWTWVADARPELEARLMVEVAESWSQTIQKKQGLFSSLFNRRNPLDEETQYTPTDKGAMTKEYAAATRLLQPHSILLQFLSSRFQAFRYRDRDLVTTCMWVIMRSAAASKTWSTHQLARELRMRLLSFGFCVLQGSRLETAVESLFRSHLYDASFSWFAIRAGWSYGSNRIQIKADLQAVEELQVAIKGDAPSYGLYTSTFYPGSRNAVLPGHISPSAAKALQAQRHQLLLVLLENEIERLRLWINPMMDPARGPVPPPRAAQTDTASRQLARLAWLVNPAVAIHLSERMKTAAVTNEVTRLVQKDPLPVQDLGDALAFFVGESITPNIRPHLKHLLYWAPVPVISALRFLFPKFGGDPILLQYALRVLEHHPVEVTFFYIPQVVQALRSDALGYAERFIFETSKISQLFCHQIIWNMKANAYRGDAGEEADPMKPTLDRMVEMIVASLSGEAQDFFQREFSFFDEVTSISAKLKPFIKASKLEKKAKIDEEMAKIKVDAGVYLPSNPDGVVVDIDRLSGRPLQSHAKAPFMATFKVHREKKKGPIQEQAVQNALIDLEEETEDAANVAGFDTWQSAIFKVGDDCRQDVLALQIIAMHKNIFTCLGLDLLVTPYRVTATGPGCGVIDVIPNATSRDEMGRAKVNDLRSFFIMKYGSADGVAFQKARTNFIQSMAAYSLLCYLVQIKDRHNGNIMIDGHGCITHIDSSANVIVDLQGVKFEPSSFKLSHEMVVLMGGRNSVGFRQFTELTVKAFLACRPYGQAVVDTATLMMAAEFPSYKGEGTMIRLKERFRLDLSEREAAEYMMSVVMNACENKRSIVYDEFQRITNGIPYAL